MAAKMSPKFVALCSLAVGAIYSSGYVITANGNTASSSGTSHPNYASLPISTGDASSQSDQAGTTDVPTTNNAKTNSSADKSSATKDTSSSSHTTNTSTSSTSKSTSSTSSKSTTTKSAQPPKPVPQFLDGTYQGSASNRIGTVGVSVTIHQGKIADVQITSCDTHYAESYIDPVLPQYVVTNQTTNIPVISGATLSTEDFYYALVQALQQGLNPNYKG